jgi:hypothetical protein
MRFNIVNSTTISASFNEALSPNIGVENVVLTSNVTGFPNPATLEINISGATMTITCQPLIPLVSYFLLFQSTSLIPFNSLNGDSYLYEDGVTNNVLILAPVETDNPILTFMQNYLGNNIYSAVYNPNSVIGSFIQAWSYELYQTLGSILQLKNENYLSYFVNDEQHLRGTGPYDRLLQAPAYNVVRVGLNPTGFPISASIPTTFGISPISLQATSATDILTISSTDIIGRFNVNDLTMTMTNQNVIILTSVVFDYSSGHGQYTYDIDQYGYQVLNSTFDQEYASSYALLENNQFRLSSLILGDPNFSLQDISQVIVNYQYQNLGINIEQSSVTVVMPFQSIREATPPIINIFNLKNAPIVDSNGNAGSVGDVTFIDPNAITPGSPHPAFVTEIPFSLSAIPASIGVYSVDYPTGTVYVYGASSLNDGTGPYPPVATYYYLHTFQSEIDYVYDPSDSELVALPFGSLINNTGNIQFDYEQALIPGIDYIAAVHVENLNESIDNRLLALNVIQTENAPVTDVFRILNETTGELYTPIRWFQNQVYFNYNLPPNIVALTQERATFELIVNEVLFVGAKITNSSSILIYQCNLQNNNIMDGTEDALGASFNSSASFGNATIFTNEIWFDINEILTNNLNRLTVVGQYMIDYANGIVYVAVVSDQDLDIGAISYRTGSITPVFPYVISVEDIYYQVSFTGPKDEEFTYSSFGNGFIDPSTFLPVDEQLLNNTIGAPYIVVGGQIGAFIDDPTLIFVPQVSSPIKFIRGIYEVTDLQNSIAPINFASNATFIGQTITVNSIVGEQYSTVFYNGTSYYTTINLNIPYLSANITFTFSVVRNSDGAQLWNGSGTIVPGNPVTLILPGINSPVVGQAVNVSYTITINPGVNVVVDYNKGEYYIDYSYLADEIIISYEYGDNVLDFSQSNSLALAQGQQYYCTYQVGALRDALQNNFGGLINIPQLSSFDVDLPRERYRDLISAALTSFLQGPTVAAMKNICNTVAHIEPEVIESAFSNWSLGSSLLTPVGFETTGNLSLVPGKFGYGILIDCPGETITLPVSSNISLGQGSFQTWISPQWYGIDNDAEITIKIIKDGVVFPSDQVFIGAGGYHPEYVNNAFSINKCNEAMGLPNLNKDGVYVYYAPDGTLNFNRWYVEVVDGYSDGYYDGSSTVYSITVSTNGEFYDNKAIGLSTPSNMVIQSSTSSINFTVSGSPPYSEGITFVADTPHYVLDFGTSEIMNRVSIFKDPSGYFNFRVFDQNGIMYSVAANVASWEPGDWHQVAAAWKLNSLDGRDEIHLFIDGFEVPNIIRYGNNVSPYLDEAFRTINPEEIAGMITANIVSSNDLQTTAGLNTVSSSLNFTALGIVNGNNLLINEAGFSTTPYTITNVDGNTLTLSSPMPFTITNGAFVVNQTSFDTLTEIDIYPNIAVSTISSILNNTDGSMPLDGNTLTSLSSNFVSSNIQPGYLLRIDNAAFLPSYTILSVTTNTLVINDTAPVMISGASFHVYPNTPVEIPGVRAVHPSYIIGEDANYNPQLTIINSAHTYDLILIETLGINHKRTQQEFYQWGIDGYGDGYENSNIINTYLPIPISLNQVSITHILLSNQIINHGNSTVVGAVFTSNNFIPDTPSYSANGRSLAVSISTTNNIDFTTPVQVVINGLTPTGTQTETLSFSSIETLYSINQYYNINYVYATGTFYSANSDYLLLNVAEQYPITTPQNSSIYPVIRYSYLVLGRATLSSLGGTTITDLGGFFSSSYVGDYIIISSPAPAAGTYQIIDVSEDHLSATISASVPAFSNGIYQILNTSVYSSGFQNGFFTFEIANQPGVPYPLSPGLYAFDYYTYLTIPFSPTNEFAYFGSDFNGNNLVDAIIDETKITSIILTDTRVGETIPTNQESITKDYNSLVPLTADVNTLVLAHYEQIPLINSALFYTTTNSAIIKNSGNYVQSAFSVNANFGNSIYLTNTPIQIDNNGILNTNSQGTIEFWVSPIYDTFNDPNQRYYFDTTSTVIENVVSTNEVEVQVSGSISQILSVKLQAGDQSIDYFAGGSVQIAATNAIQEDTISTTASSVIASQAVLQVISVQIVGDPSHRDYFQNGVIGTDGRTLFLSQQLPSNNLAVIITYKPISNINTLNQQVILLKHPLPNANTPVTVTYIPSGTQGDRMSIYKTSTGSISFDVLADDTHFVISAPIFWPANSWHRVRAQYSFDNGTNQDSMQFFVDGYEYGNTIFGTGLIFDGYQVLGSSFAGANGLISTIPFTDTVNELYIGTTYNQVNPAFARFDNIRFSDISRPIFSPYGEPIDINWSSNQSMVFPVVEDLYTTLLLDFASITTLVQNFAQLANFQGLGNDFTINILDSFGIVSDNPQVQQLLEVLIQTLKPAVSRAFINIIP